jgi:copper(I)-binding protein
MRSIILPAFAAQCLVSPLTYANEYKAGTLTITKPWSRATPKGAAVAAAYMKITNTGSEPDRLLGGSSEVGSVFQIHEMSMDNGVAKMRPLTNGLEIKPSQTLELKPSSFHIMITGLKHPLVAGSHITATLNFEKTGTVKVEYDVLAMDASPDRAMPGMQHNTH